MNYQELIHSPEGARSHIINHKQVCELMVFTDGWAAAPVPVLARHLLMGSKFAIIAGFAPKKSGGQACLAAGQQS